MVVVGPLEAVVGREARANQVAKDAAAGLLPPSEARAIRKAASQDQDYLKFLARNIDSLEQFDDAMSKVKGNMRSAVEALILPLLPMPIQTAVRRREVARES